MALLAGLGQQAVAKTAQGQRMTPRMRAYLRLLAKPIGDLREEVKREVETNPAIDDVDFSPFFRRSGTGISSEAADALLSNIQARGESLDEHLMRELRLSDLTGLAYDACAAVIANLDDHGRFIGSIPDMVMAYPGLTEKEIEAARLRVMRFDPLGCGAKNTVECLTAQLPRIPQQDRAAVEQVIARWDDLFAGRVGVGDLDPAALAALRKYRGRLTADPGERFAPRRVDTIKADITVDADGEVQVETGDIPEIRISAKYEAMAKDKSLDPETRAYAQERVRHAKELQAAILDRQSTLESIAELVVAAQGEYLKMGEKGRVKLTMTEVAKKVPCDISTVSRAASRKYVKTPRGTIPLRDFFSRIDQAPVEKLREILTDPANGPTRPTDREAAERMKKAGFPMARRTVAKYRAKLGL